MRWMIVALFVGFVAFPNVARGELSVGAAGGVDMGMAGQPGVSLDDRSAGLTMLHLLGATVSWDRWAAGVQTGVPLPPTFSLQAVTEVAHHPRGVEKSGPYFAGRLRLTPVIWVADRSICGPEAPEECRPVDGSWGGFVEPTLGWQFATKNGRFAFRPSFAYTAGFLRRHSMTPVAARFHHGMVVGLNLHVFSSPRNR